MNCKHCKADCARRGEDREKECRGHIPMTNADRIRAMSDEELLGFLMQVQHEAEKRFAAFKTPNYNEIAEWLQQPAEEVDHEV